MEAAERPHPVAIAVPARRCCRAPACKPCLFSRVGDGATCRIEKVGFSMTSRGVFGGWQASLTDTLRCVSHKVFTRLPSVASHTEQQYLCYAASGLNKHVAVSATLDLCNAASGLCKPVGVL